MFDNLISYFYYWYVRPVIKWLLFRLTRLHELQRLCYGAPSGAVRIKKVERSLELSKQQPIRMMVKNLNDYVEHNNNENFFKMNVVDICVGTVLHIKRINPRVHLDFPKMFGRCAEQIWGYRRLYHIVENMRTTPYDCGNLEHEIKLLQLWSLLMPNVPLEGRISKQWQDIGFQGDDPKTDFRGMGILGLENLIYFAREYNDTASHVLLHSLHPQFGYTFAIVGINLTSMAWNLLKSGMAKTHFYNLSKNLPNLDSFHELYCYLFFEFDKYWINCKPRSIMDFPYIQENFESKILKQLENSKTILKINLSVENI